MSNDEVTMEQLAAMVQKGFEQTSAEIKKLEQKVDSETSGIKEEMSYGFKSVGDKIDDLKDALGEPPVHRHEHDDLAGRVKYMETRLGVESGK